MSCCRKTAESDRQVKEQMHHDDDDDFWADSDAGSDLKTILACGTGAVALVGAFVALAVIFFF